MIVRFTARLARRPDIIFSFQSMILLFHYVITEIGDRNNCLRRENAPSKKCTCKGPECPAISKVAIISKSSTATFFRIGQSQESKLTN